MLHIFSVFPSDDVDYGDPNELSSDWFIYAAAV